jgi:cell division protein FtsL
MTQKLKIGEFKARYFVFWIAIFYLLGWLVYRQFEFYQEPTRDDEISNLKGRVSELDKRTDALEKTMSDLRSEVKPAPPKPRAKSVK